MPDNTEQRLTKMEVLTKDNQENIKKIVDAIYGNGKPGILTNIELMKHDLKTHIENCEKKKANWQWIITTLIAIAALIITYFK